MKSLKDFDYNLWTTNENNEIKYWVMIKSTGEITQVDINTMRVLRNSEKAMRRQIADELQNVGAVISLNKLEEDAHDRLYILNNYHQHEDEIILNLHLEAFKHILTKKQLAVFEECILDKKKHTHFAEENNIKSQGVDQMVKAIRKKAKIFF